MSRDTGSYFLGIQAYDILGSAVAGRADLRSSDCAMLGTALFWTTVVVLGTMGLISAVAHIDEKRDQKKFAASDRRLDFPPPGKK